MTRISEEIRNQFTQGDHLNRLILINVGVFVLLLIIKVFAALFQAPGLLTGIMDWITLPSDPMTFITRPWTLVTYMFTHLDFFHILFNLLILYFTGKIFLDFLGERRLLGTYLLGGLAGGILFVISYNLFPLFTQSSSQHVLLGASAGVMAILIGTATYTPSLPVRLFFVLEVRLWVVALLVVLMDLAQIPVENPGGHIAHLGGAAMGYLIVRGLRTGKDYSEGFVRFWEDFFQSLRGEKKVKKVYSKKRTGGFSKRDSVSEDTQERLNEILDKIRQSGYEGLTKEEKEFLFKYSRK